MIFDYYAFLEKQKAHHEYVNQGGLTSGFVDSCTVMLHQNKDKARKTYMKHVQKLSNLTSDTIAELKPDLENLPGASWIGIKISFTLTTPWYSRDDHIFHILDNPVRKDRVFGAPFMSASSWKGLLRWACRMQEGLPEYLNKENNFMDNWQDPPWIVHLFGNEKKKDKEVRQGTIVFYPTWFAKTGFEVINPHSREKRAGIKPIHYEVVPPGTAGCLYLLYAPLNRDNDSFINCREEALSNLIPAVQSLLEVYGISAKRTVGWGTARIEKWQGFPGNGRPFSSESPAEFLEEVVNRIAPEVEDE